MFRTCLIASAALSVALFAQSGLAAEKMKTQGSMSMMKKGEAFAVMPDGHMGNMKMDKAMMGSMAKMAKPIDHCMMMMTDSDGKVWAVDTSTPDAMKECEKMAK